MYRCSQFQDPGFCRRELLERFLASQFASSRIAPFLSFVSLPAGRFNLTSLLSPNQHMLHPVVTAAFGLTLVVALENQYQLDFTGLVLYWFIRHSELSEKAADASSLFFGILSAFLV